MKKIFLVTGAAGHLGNTIIQQLAKRNVEIRALLLPQEKDAALEGQPCTIYRGNVCEKGSLREFFALPAGARATMIHCAGVVSIESKRNPRVEEVNVQGTKNIVEMCRESGVEKMVYVSSVHAIPEKPKGETICEVEEFSPDLVEGLYAKTKAEATRYVLEQAASGFPVCVVHPSGIIGPYDYGHGHLTQMVIDAVNGALAAGVDGGYDFVDVRDVARGVISAAERGQTGRCYILSNRYAGVKELLNKVAKAAGTRPVRVMLHMWIAKATAPFSELYYRILRRPPLYTAYSLYTLTSNSKFSHERASKELFYHPRALMETVTDTVEWLRAHGRIKKEKKELTHRRARKARKATKAQ